MKLKATILTLLLFSASIYGREAIDTTPPDTFIDVPNPRNEPVEEHLQNLDRQVERVSRYMDCYGCPSSSLCGSHQIQRTQAEQHLLDEEWKRYLSP